MRMFMLLILYIIINLMPKVHQKARGFESRYRFNPIRHFSDLVSHLTVWRHSVWDLGQAQLCFNSYNSVITQVFYFLFFFRLALIKFYFFPLKMKSSNSKNIYRRLVFLGTHINDKTFASVCFASALTIEI